MSDDHVAPDQLLEAGHLLPHDRAYMGDELQVEVGDPETGIADAGRRLPDVPASPPEAEVAPLDGVEEQRAVHLRLGRRHERRVALQLDQPERRSEGGDHGANEVGEDVLGVVELDPREVAGVPRDVGDEEAGPLRRFHGPTIIRTTLTRGSVC
jgi:hypothetical protein